MDQRSLSLSKENTKPQRFVTSTWHLLYKWTVNLAGYTWIYLIIENIEDADRNDIGWPAEIILAKLVKSLAANILVETTQMLEPGVFTSFHNRGEKSTHQRNQRKAFAQKKG